MRPNIVFFMTDQLRRDALGCYGNEICRTPNLDGVAAAGTRFDHAYTTAPVCSPSRASIMTGLYSHNHGVMMNTHIAPAWNRGLSPDTPTFSERLQAAGYNVDYVGKWHVNEDLGPEEFGFDVHQIERPESMKGVERPFFRHVDGSPLIIDFNGQPFAVGATADYPETEHITTLMTEAGLRVIRQRAEEDKPFFLRIDVNAPHFINLVPEPYASMYDPESIPPWENFDETFENKPACHLRKHQEWNLQDKDWAWWRQVVAKYYGDVSLVDHNVGRVLDEIRASGIEDETIFVFATDHGDSLGSHKHFEKGGTMYDEVFRVPLLVKAPGSSSSEVNEFVRLQDLMPSFIEWGGGEIPDDLDARSVAPLVDGTAEDDWPDSVYCEHHGEVWGYQSQRMVRTERWKYVFDPHDLDELYDLDADPAEMNNLIDDPAFTDVQTEMRARLMGWNDATGDMFNWPWVRWNFPDPIAPGDAAAACTVTA